MAKTTINEIEVKTFVSEKPVGFIIFDPVKQAYRTCTDPSGVRTGEEIVALLADGDILISVSRYRPDGLIHTEYLPDNMVENLRQEISVLDPATPPPLSDYAVVLECAQATKESLTATGTYIDIKGDRLQTCYPESQKLFAVQIQAVIKYVDNVNVWHGDEMKKATSFIDDVSKTYQSFSPRVQKMFETQLAQLEKARENMYKRSRDSIVALFG